MSSLNTFNPALTNHLYTPFLGPNVEPLHIDIDTMSPWPPSSKEERPSKHHHRHSRKRHKKRSKKHRLGAYMIQLIGLICLVMAGIKAFEPLIGVGFTLVIVGYRGDFGRGDLGGVYALLCVWRGDEC